MKRLTILCIAIFSLSSYAEGSDWIFVGETKDSKQQLYYDKDSIHYPDRYREKGWFGSERFKTSKDVVGVWIKWIKMTGMKEDRALTNIYCSSRQISITEIIKDGKSQREPSAVVNIQPDSLIEDLYKIMCR